LENSSQSSWIWLWVYKMPSTSPHVVWIYVAARSVWRSAKSDAFSGAANRRRTRTGLNRP
jgi:hypothetical protein